jgi:hypothetical protein
VIDDRVAEAMSDLQMLLGNQMRDVLSGSLTPTAGNRVSSRVGRILTAFARDSKGGVPGAEDRLLAAVQDLRDEVAAQRPSEASHTSKASQ